MKVAIDHDYLSTRCLNISSHTYICHTKSAAALKYFIQRPGVIDWAESITFTGVPNDVIPALTDVCRKHKGVLTSKEARFMYAWKKSTPPELPPIPDGLCLTSLEKKHATIMAEDWKGKRNKQDLEGYFLSVIQNFESSCLLDKEGELQAYICMQYNGSMAMLYVRPEINQREEYFDLILSDLTRKILAKKDIAYCFIPTEHTDLVNSSRKLGFEWVPQGNMTWSRFIPLSHFVAKNSGQNSDTCQESESVDGLTGSKLNINAIPLTISHGNATNWSKKHLVSIEICIAYEINNLSLQCKQFITLLGDRNGLVHRMAILDDCALKAPIFQDIL
ncbi:hypothetical protein KUTeg_005504 [Tegillarca granosa]|uniref:Glycine N-acyltransferase-like protein n=1 Tax=Tegillarca granosa TaxID=220873 RepID=A0ABQ9FJZ7_TEGGR|nr:hypothetical protein KUTeg_005504 [Tegillarca granosa]